MWSFYKFQMILLQMNLKAMGDLQLTCNHTEPLEEKTFCISKHFSQRAKINIKSNKSFIACVTVISISSSYSCPNVCVCVCVCTEL